MPNPTLYYLPVRGRAELIRLVLAETGQPYDEHPVTQGTPPRNGRPTDWTELKAAGLLPFGAVPVWEEPDGFRLAQSLAIARYLAKPHELLGKNPREEAQVDQMLGAFDDLRPEFRRLVTCPPEDRARVRAELSDTVLPRWLGYLDRLLCTNRDGAGFLVGESFSVADLALWYLLELTVDNGFGAALNAHPKLRAFAERIGRRPRLAAWVASERRARFLPPPA